MDNDNFETGNGYLDVELWVSMNCADEETEDCYDE